MKKFVYYSMTALCLAVFALSCQKNSQDDKYIEENPNLITLTCAFPTLDNENGTKVTLGANGKTAWEADVDAIVFQGCPKSGGVSIPPVTHTFTSAELANPEVASFSVDLSGLVDDEGMNHQINVAYPAGIWSSYSPDHMYGRSAFSNTNKMLMAGYVDGSSINLFHLTAAVTFQVAGTEGDYDSYIFKGNNDEVVGYSKLLVEVNKPNVTSYRKKYKTSAPWGSAGPLTSITGTVISDGTAVNTVFLPVNTMDNAEGTENENGANIVYLPTGFTIQLLKGGVIKKYITSTAPLTIRPGHMINLGELPAAHIHDYVILKRDNTIGVDVSTATDLSASATANCYIVDGSVAANAGASFKFKAAKGKGGAALSTIGGDDDNDVVILWSTKNTAEAPGANEIISAVDYDIQEGEDAYIVFKMPNPIVPGNAVIAAKDSGGSILWSWHIWVPKDAISYSTYGDKTSSKLMMSRNLGALVDAPADGSVVDITSLGLLYQWGRKDPFVGAQSLGSTSFAAVSGTAKTNNGGKMSVDQTVANPTVFGNTSDDLRDWNSTPDNALWGANGSNKTQYDPCPVGYRVPTRDLLKSFIDAVTWTPSMVNYYVKADDIVYYGFPIANHIYAKYGNMYGYEDGPVTYLWTSYRDDDAKGTAYAMRIKNDGSVKLSATYKSSGCSVRCVAE